MTNPTTTTIIFILLTLYTSLSQSTRILPVKDPQDILITFGSCNGFHGDEPNDIFYRIAEMKPDLWIWLGDVAYLDNDTIPLTFTDAYQKRIEERFHNSKTSPAYVALREATNVIGVWDDHDFGLDNSGKNFPYKNITKKYWLEYIDEPADSPRRHREGMYDSYYVGDTSKIKVILVDVRYFMDDESGIFDSKDMLGEKQWQWLEQELMTNTAQYVLIGSGLQVLPDDRPFAENWSPESRDRLLGLIRKHRVSGVTLLSGDMHYGEIMKHPCKERLGHELYEITSSGLTHHLNQHILFADEFIESMNPETWNTNKERYMRENYGTIRFKFGEESSVRAEVRNFTGFVVLEQEMRYEELEFDEEVLDDESVCEMDRNRYVRFVENAAKAVLTGRWFPIIFVSIPIVLIGICIMFIWIIYQKIFKTSKTAPNKKIKEM